MLERNHQFSILLQLICLPDHDSTMYPSEDILEAAKSIRPFLPGLLNHQAQEVDNQLADLINRHNAGEPLENKIAELLATHDPTREWMRQFLDSKHPANVTKGLGFNPLPGISAPGAPKYVCPQGDYIWPQIDISDPIPPCPTHNIPLVLSEDS